MGPIETGGHQTAGPKTAEEEAPAEMARRLALGGVVINPPVFATGSCPTSRGDAKGVWWSGAAWTSMAARRDSEM